MPKPLRILGFDASSSDVGYCAIVEGTVIASGAYSPKGDSGWVRMLLIANWMRRPLPFEIDGHPATLADFTVVAAEEPTGSHGNALTDRILGAAMWTPLVLAHLAGVTDLRRVNAMKVKASGWHKGVAKVVAQFLGKETITEHEADAVGVAMHVWNEMRIDRMVAEAQAQAQ